MKWPPELDVLEKGMLDAIYRGKITISVDGKPLIVLDRDSKSVDVEMSGLERMDIKISDLFIARKERRKVLLESSETVRELAKLGVRCSLYDKGEPLVTAGGPSKAGHGLRFNPLKIGRILKAV